MAKKPSDKLAQKRQALIERTATALRVSHADAEAFLRMPRHQSVRVNPLKGKAYALLLF